MKNSKQCISIGKILAGENLKLPTNVYSLGSKNMNQKENKKLFLLGTLLGTVDNAEF